MTEWMTGNDGVQVGLDDFGHVLIRNSADPAEYLVFGELEFAEFLAAAKAGNLDHFVTDVDDLVQLKSADEWGRPRCQEIIRYVDTLVPVQCGMTEDHDGDCDPLPLTPDIDEILTGAYVTVMPVDASGLVEQLTAPAMVFTQCPKCTTEYNSARHLECPECNATIPGRPVFPGRR